MYKVGDIVNNKEIIDIQLRYYSRQNCTAYIVRCLRCGTIHVFKTKQLLDKSPKTHCKVCKQYLNGKFYSSQREIAKDYGVCQATVSLHNVKHNGDISQIGKGRSSKYARKPKYNVGDIVNGREILEKLNRKYSGEKRPGGNTCYKVKCLKCGAICILPSKDFEKHNCICMSADKISEIHILSEKPREGRKLNLPKNITYRVNDNKYEVCVCAGGRNKPESKRWRERYDTIEECLKRLPVLKELALEYKKQLLNKEKGI